MGIAGDGAIDISIAAGTAGDSLGNLASSVGPSDTFIVDNTAPTAVTLSVSPTVTNSTDIVADFGGSTDSNGVEYKLKLDGGSYATQASPRTIAVAGLGEGVHAVYVKAVDPAGNESAEATATFTCDKAPPAIQSASYSPALIAGGDPVSIVVEATDNYEVTSVTADSTVLINSSGSLWTGTLTADSTLGLHSVALVAQDAAGNSTSSDWPYTTVPSFGLRNLAAAAPIMAAASGRFVFTVWGKVTSLESDGFLLNDGSGRQIKVVASGHGLVVDDYASARGTLDVSSDPPVLTAHVVTKQN